MKIVERWRHTVGSA